MTAARTIQVEPEPTRAEVALWVERCAKEGPIAYLEVHREMVGGLDRSGCVLGSDTSGAKLPAALADEVSVLMQDEADAWGGDQIFVVHCFRPEGDPRFADFAGRFQRRARFMFRGVRGPSAQGPELATDEAIEKTFASFAAVSMRQSQVHTERMGEIAIGAADKLGQRHDREMSAKDRRISELETKLAERDAAHAKLLQELADLRHKHAVEVIKAQTEAELIQVGAGMLKTAGPAVLSRLLPQATAPNAEPGNPFREFFADVTPRQLHRIASEPGWNPAQIAILATITDAYKHGKVPNLQKEQIAEFVASATGQQLQKVEDILGPELGERLKAALLSELPKEATT